MPTDNLKTWPEKIYLQVRIDDDEELPKYQDVGEVTWYPESIVDCEVTYIRADLAASQEIECLHQQLTVLMKIINDDGSLETFEDHRFLLVDMRAAYRGIVEVSGTIEELSCENVSLRHKIAELQKDAERYRYLREKGMDFSAEFATGEFQKMWLTGIEMDRAVDIEKDQDKEEESK